MAGAKPYRQSAGAVRFDWGAEGAAAVSDGARIAVVVDVLSFTTTLSVAIDNGVDVFPYRFRDGSAAAFAASRSARLAVGRSEAGATGLSLSPLSVRRAVADRMLDRGARLVLPSPNGSAISRELADAGVVVVGACLRNARAVGRWVANQAPRGPIAVVAAGERWPGDRLRPAVEDLWGAGAVIRELRQSGITNVSPEALAAEAAFTAVADLPAALKACASGQELIDDGYGDELKVAIEVDQSTLVPVLRSDAFQAA